MKKRFVSCLFLLMAFFIMPGIVKAGELNIHALNCGISSGDATLLESKGQFLLMDTCNYNTETYGGTNIIPQRLKEFNVKKFSIYIYHYHIDHHGNVISLLNNKDFTIENLYLPNPDYLQYSNSLSTLYKKYQEIVNLAKSKGVTVKNIGAGNTFKIGDANAEVLWRSNIADCWNKKPYNDSYINSMSLVTLIKVDNVKFLTAGDIEIYTENKLLNNSTIKSKISNVDIFKLSHRGYNNQGNTQSNTDAFMKVVNPKYSYCQIPDFPSQGFGFHGDSDVKQYYEYLRTKLVPKYNIYSSGYNGTVTFNIKNNKIVANPSRNYRTVHLNYITKKQSGSGIDKVLQIDDYKFNDASPYFSIEDAKTQLSGYTYMNTLGLEKTNAAIKTNGPGADNNAQGQNYDAYVAFYTPTNKVSIRYRMNGGRLGDMHRSAVSTSGDYITANGTSIITSVNYNNKIGTDGLADYNNSTYINIEKTGYKAVSGKEWNTKANGSGTSYDQAVQYSASDFCNANNNYCLIDLYVNWTPISYTLKYNLNGGAVSGNPATFNINTATITLKNPTKAGYTFTGWTGSNGETASKSVTIAKGTTGNKTYTANYSPTSYKITYNLDGGEVSGNPSSYTVETNDITLKNPTKAGYTFVGWTGSNGETASKSVTIAKGTTGNKTYTANWTVNKVYIKLNANGGSLAEAHGETFTLNGGKVLKNNSENIQTLNYGATLGTNGLTNLYSFGIMPNHDITLYAKWSENENIISYELNGGENNPSNPTTYITGEEKTLYDGQREGYAFTGWYRDASYETKVVKITSTMNEDITLYAKWEKRNM